MRIIDVGQMVPSSTRLAASDDFTLPVPLHSIVEECAMGIEAVHDIVDDDAEGTSDLLSATLDYGEDPNESIMSFNAALAAAKRKNTLDEDDVKGQFIHQAMDSDYYQPVVSRLLLHDQRAAESRLTQRRSGG
ncbi:hypothetical protein CYMTET_32164 [Cymbomonas tetramitiformis]|uniref:Uncharacterized protein n=1 Tax=Cymbomonas tetramitiformis TaxID=36881 RepID=A0AAE0FG76_9CHLO|nr:hypothetical protein CYMTET_32164 [Cymbomonas tetramitiformis]